MRDEIRDFLVSILKEKGDTEPFSDNDSLILTGRLQSVDVLELAIFIEKKYDIDFAEQGFDQDVFDSVDSIVSFIEKCIKAE
jgi:acyl carrier protein